LTWGCCPRLCVTAEAAGEGEGVVRPRCLCVSEFFLCWKQDELVDRLIGCRDINWMDGIGGMGWDWTGLLLLMGECAVALLAPVCVCASLIP
jgi:hypothetical protein